MRTKDSTIADRLLCVQGRIKAAAERAGRNPADIKLVAVSKGHPAESIREAQAAGQIAFGENYFDEAVSKIETVRENAEWHMLGHVQSRKAAGVAARFSVVHSVDSVALAERLSRACQEQGSEISIFLECNITGETSKFGFPLSSAQSRDALLQTWNGISNLPGLQVVGFMTMAPFSASPLETRAVFRALRELRDASREAANSRLRTGLSMGMSDDFEEAIEEGATIVRIGRAIFGPRPPRISR
jgi:PLP dependent protein